MHATIRQYTGIQSGAVDEVVRRRAEIEALVKQTAGFAQYDLIRTASGVTSVTLCETAAGCEDSNRRVAAWIKENMPTMVPNPPQIMTGEDVIHATAG
jgi:hypothetical protein